MLDFFFSSKLAVPPDFPTSDGSCTVAFSQAQPKLSLLVSQPVSSTSVNPVVSTFKMYFKIWPPLATSAMTLIHAIITFCLDDCSHQLAGFLLLTGFLPPLKSILIITAKVIRQDRKSDLLTPLLKIFRSVFEWRLKVTRWPPWSVPASLSLHL